ncbi:MAG: GNAT family N-acetyltransferase, partial [Saprospiraceae bacterium]|nr:GNAT family N-acetyltransferase [Saprospiraceae bacterium]
MDFTLSFPSDEHVISGITDFTYTWGINCGLSRRAALELALATTEVTTDIIRFAYHTTDETFDIRYKSSAKQAEVILYELGQPFRPERYVYRLENVLSHHDFSGAGFKVIQYFTDEFLYLNKGKEGKEFRLMKEVTDEHITHLVDRHHLESAPVVDRNYSMSLVDPDHADEVSRLIYRVYRHSYYKDVLYYPRKLASAIEQGRKFGVLTRCGNGEPCGFFAVIRNRDSNIGEVGEAVVLKTHRRQGLMKRMLEFLINESRERQLLGLFGEANASHLYSQRANARFDFKSTAILLALMPPMQMSGFASDQVNQPVSAV